MRGATVKVEILEGKQEQWAQVGSTAILHGLKLCMHVQLLSE